MECNLFEYDLTGKLYSTEYLQYVKYRNRKTIKTVFQL